MSCMCRRVSSKSRCRTPLVELCVKERRVVLRLNHCDPCFQAPDGIVISQNGCEVEYEEVCIPAPQSTCGQPCYGDTKIRRPKFAKHYVVYPITTLSADGEVEFYLDDNLLKLGAGRYHATLLILKDEKHRGSERLADYYLTNTKFDIELILGNLDILSVEQTKGAQCAPCGGA